MAGKISEMTDGTASQAADRFEITRDPTGTPATRYQDMAGVADWIDAKAAYGSMSVQSGSAAEATTDATPRKIAAWTNDDLEQNMTADKTTGNDITADVSGTFSVNCGVSFSGTGNKNYMIEIYKNGSATGFSAERKLGAGGDVGRVAIPGIVALAATDTLELYQWSTDGGSTMTVTEAVMAAVRISN